jgi:hypothetical protein
VISNSPTRLARSDSSFGSAAGHLSTFSMSCSVGSLQFVVLAIRALVDCNCCSVGCVRGSDGVRTLCACVPSTGQALRPKLGTIGMQNLEACSASADHICRLHMHASKLRTRQHVDQISI